MHPSHDDIETLRNKAAIAGNDLQVAICDLALHRELTAQHHRVLDAAGWDPLTDHKAAVAECKRVILAAIGAQ